MKNTMSWQQVKVPPSKPNAPKNRRRRTSGLGKLCGQLAPVEARGSSMSPAATAAKLSLALVWRFGFFWVEVWRSGYSFFEVCGIGGLEVGRV